jgi:hypothetical protein
VRHYRQALTSTSNDLARKQQSFSHRHPPQSQVFAQQRLYNNGGPKLNATPSKLGPISSIRPRESSSSPKPSKRNVMHIVFQREPQVRYLRSESMDLRQFLIPHKWPYPRRERNGCRSEMTSNLNWKIQEGRGCILFLSRGKRRGCILLPIFNLKRKQIRFGRKDPALSLIPAN